MTATEPDDNKQNNSESQSTGASLLIRVVLLAVWVVMVDLWLARHFRSGVGFNDVLKLFGVPAASLLSVGVIDFLLGKEKRESFVDSLKDYLRGFLRTHLKGVLWVLYLGSALVGATYTTVSIDATADGRKKFVLSSLAFPDKSVSGETAVDKVRDIHMWVNPFAPEYKLTVEGFLSGNIRVKPFFGTLIVPGRDLVATPTVLFRPDFTSSLVLASGGWFQLYQKTADGFVMIAEEQGTHAWYLGPRRNQPGELLSDWRLETAELGLGQQEVAILMRRWRNPRLLETAAIGPNQILCALVSNIDKTRYVAGTVTIVSRKEYIDLLIGDLRNEQDTSTINSSGPSLCTWLDTGAG